MRNKGFAAWKLLIVLPVLTCTFLAGFVAADAFGGAFHSPSGTLNLLRSTVTGWMNPSEKTELNPTQAFQGVLSEIEEHAYKQPPKREELTYSAIRGMLSALGDPYTRFMDPTEFRKMQEDTRGDFVGIGAQLDDASDGAKIVRPIPNSPAERAGLKAGDVIIKVDDKVLNNIALDDIVRLIRGQRGTPVTLTIRREGEAQNKEFKLIRDRIESPTVDYYLEDAENKIYRVWLQNFSEKAPALLDQKIKEFKQEGGKALILDLRYNPGGLLDSAVEIVSRFLPKRDVAVIIQHKGGEQEKLYTNPNRYRNLGVPVVVLINGGSASASEIVSGALKDHQISPLVGEDSFGKGLVQTVITTSPNTAVAITTAKYLTPKGTYLHRKIVNEKPVGGLKPDYEVKPVEEWRMSDENRSDDIQLQKALEILRKKLNAQDSGTGEMRASVNP
jgi:carboxyl-terminal processing protease